MASRAPKGSIVRYADDLRQWRWPPNERPVSAPDRSDVVESGPLKSLIWDVVPASMGLIVHQLLIIAICILIGTWVEGGRWAIAPDGKLSFGAYWIRKRSNYFCPARPPAC